MTNERRGASVRDTGARPDPRGAARRAGRYTLIYDDACPMCSTWAERVRGWDRRHRVDLVAAHGEEVCARFPWITRASLDAAMQLVEPDGTTHSGAAAAEVLVRILPFGSVLRLAFVIPGARAIAARVYRAVAARRCRDACAVHVARR